MSKVDVIMPQMGESIAEGTLTRWLKSVGDVVERDEDLFEISTDKVDADIPSPATGTLTEILVQEGDTVEVNSVVARIDTAGESAGETAAAVEEPAVAAEEPAAPAAATEPPAAEEPMAAPAAAADALPAEGGDQPMTREERLRTKSTPLVRKLAEEHGVTISQVTGTGMAGRVTRDDLLAYLASRPAEAAAAPVTPAAPPSASAPVPGTPVAAPSMGEPGMMRVPIHGATLDIKIPGVTIREGDRVEEMSRVRLRTMEHMLLSKRISAHVTSVTEIDFERVVQLRRKLKGKYADKGVKLTYGPFIMKAVTEGLLAYPILNSSVNGTQIVYHGDVNLGIAVSINDGKELIVPVLKNADRLSLMGLASGANDLADKARTKSLDFDDIQGGTFTITNVGVFGNLFGTPIVNQPQVAILGTGVIEKRPVVVQDTMGNDVIGIRHMSYFGLSYDHRVVDGAMAAFFLNKVQEVLENFPEDGV
ncbi:MAG: dihydrolipoamide acetyltransferase family protein [Gemmatimonadota bacterium]